LRLALPESSQAQKSGAHEAPPLVISIDAKGTLRFGSEAKPVTVERLKEELRDAITANPALKLAIAADTTAPFGQVIKVSDAAKEAKIKEIITFTRPEGSVQ
jgi:biopolymer transport protein ExbD